MLRNAFPIIEIVMVQRIAPVLIVPVPVAAGLPGFSDDDFRYPVKPTEEVRDACTEIDEQPLVVTIVARWTVINMHGRYRLGCFVRHHPGTVPGRYRMGDETMSWIVPHQLVQLSSQTLIFSVNVDEITLTNGFEAQRTGETHRGVLAAVAQNVEVDARHFCCACWLRYSKSSGTGRPDDPLRAPP